MHATNPSPQSPMQSLRRFVRARAAQESCELCALPLGPEHSHLIERSSRRLICSCDACAILFDSGQSGRYRRVPRRIEHLDDFCITDAQWENLHLPIHLAFFFFSSQAKRVVAMFPGPAGATESLLTLEAWEELVASNPFLRELEPDVEALLVNRVGKTHEYCRVPIDQCYRLVGLIRTHWRGLSGGTEVWKHIGEFFAEMRNRSVTKEARHA